MKKRSLLTGVLPQLRKLHGATILIRHQTTRKTLYGSSEIEETALITRVSAVHIDSSGVGKKMKHEVELEVEAREFDDVPLYRLLYDLHQPDQATAINDSHDETPVSIELLD